MNYEERMDLEAQKKKKNQGIGLLLIIVFLLGFLYVFYNWQQENNQKKFLKVAKATLKSVNDNYKNDKMLDDNLSDQTFTYPNSSILNFNTNGSLKGGTIIQYGDGTVAFAFHNNKLCAIKKRTASSSNIEIIAYNADTCVIK